MKYNEQVTKLEQIKDTEFEDKWTNLLLKDNIAVKQYTAAKQKYLFSVAPGKIKNPDR